MAAQVGVSEAEQILCAERVNLTQLLTVGLGLASMYYILKFLLRLMKGLDKAGKPAVSRGYFAHQVQDSVYSLVAALIPVFIPVFLNVAGIDVVACLFP